MADLTVAQLEAALSELVAAGPLLQLAHINIPTVLISDARLVLGEIQSGRIHDGMTAEEIAVEVAKIATGVGVTLPGFLDTAFNAVTTYEADRVSLEGTPPQAVVVATTSGTKLPDGKTFAGDLLLAPRGSDVDGLIQGTLVASAAPI